MLEVQNLSKTYNPGKKNALAALHDVSLTIADGEMVAVTRTSGAGKSTLLHILGGVLSFDTGSYHLDGEEVGNLSEKKLAVLRNRKVGTVFQSFCCCRTTPSAKTWKSPCFLRACRRKTAGALPKGVGASRYSRTFRPPGQRAFRRAEAARRHCPRDCQSGAIYSRRRADRRARLQNRRFDFRLVPSNCRQRAHGCNCHPRFTARLAL